MLRAIGDLEPQRQVLQTVAGPQRKQLPCEVQRVKETMRWKCDPQSYERHGQKAEVKGSIVRQEEGVRLAEEFDEARHDLFNGGLSSHHRIGDAVNLLDVPGNGYLRVDELLEGGEFPAVQPKADSADFDQLVHDGKEAGGFGFEGQKGDLSEPLMDVMHEPSRLFPGEPLTWETAVTVHRLGATVQSGSGPGSKR